MNPPAITSEADPESTSSSAGSGAESCTQSDVQPSAKSGRQSCLYEGYVRHRRFLPKSHCFRYPVRYAYLDLSELEEVFALSRLWGLERRAPVSFRRSDYLGPADVPLDCAVRDRAEQLLGERPTGPIRLLTGLGSFGFGFNPVSFYYVFEPGGEQLQAVLAEITNTPWGERHTYALPAVPAESRGVRARFPKRFHVSPFLDLDVGYHWSFNTPAEHLAVHMDDFQAGSGKPYAQVGERLFDATLVLRRRALDEVGARSLALRQPSFPLYAHFGIYLQAALLYLKRVPFYSRPQAS